MASTLPTFGQKDQLVDVEADAADIQRGKYKTPTFFGDISSSTAHKIFTAGVNAAVSYSGQTARKNEIVTTREVDSQYLLTQHEFDLLRKRALSISNYAKIPYDVCEDFLIILCFVDQINDMIKIADAVQIDELANPAILRQPMQILNIRGLEKISFAAQAVDGLVNLYRKYLTSSQNVTNKSQGDDSQSILNALASIVGGFGGSPGPRLDTSELGNFLSELITGKRIPTNVIAKNPLMQSPSYVGKAFFGELNNNVANVDIDQLFNKAIAIFPQPTNGSGTSSFSMQNFGSFSKAMPLINFAAKVITGSADVSSARKLAQVMQVVDKINDFTGSKSTDSVDVTRADNAIPVMMAMATSLSGLNKSVFSDSTFQNGWVLAQSVGSVMASTNPQFIEAARKFL